MKLAGVDRPESREAEGLGDLNQRSGPQTDLVIGSDKATSKIVPLDIPNYGMSLAFENEHLDRQPVIENGLKVLNADLKASVLAETNNGLAFSGHAGAYCPRQGKTGQFKPRGTDESLARLKPKTQ